MAININNTKRLAISKANAQILGVLVGASFVTIFCLVISQQLFVQSRYQARVISQKNKANNQLTSNIKVFQDLRRSYTDFDSKNPNVIGGQRQGIDDRDGNNAKIMLDALPSSYDFPALTSSLEKILTQLNVNVTDITGTDDQLIQQTHVAEPTPQAVSVPFSFSVKSANYTSIQKIIDTLQLSIRPIQIDTIDTTGGGSDMAMTVSAHTFYQPSKNLDIKKQVVK